MSKKWANKIFAMHLSEVFLIWFFSSRRKFASLCVTGCVRVVHKSGHQEAQTKMLRTGKITERGRGLKEKKCVFVRAFKREKVCESVRVCVCVCVIMCVRVHLNVWVCLVGCALESERERVCVPVPMMWVCVWESERERERVMLNSRCLNKIWPTVCAQKMNVWCTEADRHHPKKRKTRK